MFFHKNKIEDVLLRHHARRRPRKKTVEGMGMDGLSLILIFLLTYLFCWMGIVEPWAGQCIMSGMFCVFLFLR